VQVVRIPYDPALRLRAVFNPSALQEATLNAKLQMAAMVAKRLDFAIQRRRGEVTGGSPPVLDLDSPSGRTQTQPALVTVPAERPGVEDPGDQDEPGVPHGPQPADEYPPGGHRSQTGTGWSADVGSQEVAAADETGWPEMSPADDGTTALQMENHGPVNGYATVGGANGARGQDHSTPGEEPGEGTGLIGGWAV
jgi:hypothetical protein